MDLDRSAGILLHPTSLPGPFGIGDLGPTSHKWIADLRDSGCKLWQTLPLGPTGYGDSPYQCFSSFAGNPNLVSPEALIDDGLLLPYELNQYPNLPEDRVDFGEVITAKTALLDLAATRIDATGLRSELEAFRNDQSHWLDDFSLFMAIKEINELRPWWTWNPSLRDRVPSAIAEIKNEFGELIERQVFRQFAFFRQWESLRRAARQSGITVIGDAPIFVAADSADVWANRTLFFLNRDGRPNVVAGVPPDYFSETGQLWGNPLYDWDSHKRRGYDWWLRRLEAIFAQVDVVRLDHFRGFSAYWEVPADEETAIRGRWVPGPGADFLKTVKKHFNDLPLIAEDLGVITDEVKALRDSFSLPGMKILQFAFDSGEDNDFLPHNYPENCVVYTGTHDNDTTRGWFDEASELDKAFALEYLGVDGTDYTWDLIRTAWRSNARWALAPMQDILDLDSSARMNIPSTLGGNWEWRMEAEAFTKQIQDRLRNLNRESDR